MSLKKVKLFANLREAAGTSAVEIPGDDIKELLDNLIAKYPSLEEIVLEEDGKIRGYINILVNGNNIQHLDGLDTRVSDSDEIAMFPPVSGG
ncbi:ubiquitin-like small modifier protein 1 [Methanohalophilus sp.]|uniref:ubiquitin-like small modifier protein 1 n=1 Tax=Methanohalophilus sp. TaxID=1966352 RepID=UPI002627F86A|nr:ubiquitin-like small modifier protein 1 [Methanohalophilus sp.]MDK2891779.1 sulfur-carrier protein [Methanohalophilus sp.]